MTLSTERGRLMVACPDQPGIIAAVSRFLFDCGANIVHSDQHTTDPSGGRFFLRVEFDLPELVETVGELDAAFTEAIAVPRQMVHRFTVAARQKRLAVFVSKEEHCLLELLWQQRSGDLGAQIAVVVSNHPDCGPLVAPFGVPFHHITVTRETKAEAEASQLAVLAEMSVDAVVLARYMQIVSSEFIRHWEDRIINIHHSFLPAFVGAKPYAQAHERGVKIIGATAHYVTEALDAGPIIEQDVQRVDHRHTTEDLKRIGRQIERTVLARAVAWHAQDRVLVYGNKTVVFA
ncbi:MAG: formyltetrahydrofolate deformylase [Cytophagales bacterium]|nr:formyltetrahydrofolate deformylase [Armatimonadota bacterium]